MLRRCHAAPPHHADDAFVSMCFRRLIELQRAAGTASRRRIGSGRSNVRRPRGRRSPRPRAGPAGRRPEGPGQLSPGSRGKRQRYVRRRPRCIFTFILLLLQPLGHAMQCVVQDRFISFLVSSSCPHCDARVCWRCMVLDGLISEDYDAVCRFGRGDICDILWYV